MNFTAGGRNWQMKRRNGTARIAGVGWTHGKKAG